MVQQNSNLHKSTRHALSRGERDGPERIRSRAPATGRQKPQSHALLPTRCSQRWTERYLPTQFTSHLQHGTSNNYRRPQLSHQRIQPATQEKQTSLAPPPTNPHRRPQERHDYALQRAPASPSPTRGRHRALAGALIRPRRRALHAALATEVRGAGQGRETSCDRVLRRRALGGLGSRARVSGSGVDGDAGFVLLEVGYVLFETGPWTGPESSPGWSRSVGCDR